MGWRSDWLYCLVFREITKVIERAQQTDRSHGKPPSLCHVAEYANADWETALPQGTVVRRWILRSGENAEEVEPTDTIQVLNDSTDGMFYREAAFTFHIDSNRKRVLFMYVLGPLYGRGRILNVKFQGRDGRLVPGGGREWVS